MVGLWAGCNTTGTTITTVITDCVSQYRFYGLQIESRSDGEKDIEREEKKLIKQKYTN